MIWGGPWLLLALGSVAADLRAFVIGSYLHNMRISRVTQISAQDNLVAADIPRDAQQIIAADPGDAAFKIFIQASQAQADLWQAAVDPLQGIRYAL